MEPRKTVAVIGCGASAVAFLHSFVDICIDNQIDYLDFIIFEPSSELGSGLAYQTDTDNLIINRPLESMSVNVNISSDFKHWMDKHHISSKDIITDGHTTYSSRPLFGKYLSDTLEKVLLKALQNHIQIRIVRKTAIKVLKTESYKIITADNEVLHSNYIIFCTGNNQPHDIYSLNETPSYINNPYPLYPKINSIQHKKTIAVLGNSLTAIDIALALSNKGYKGKIILFSRSPNYPKVRGPIRPYKLKFLTNCALTNIKQTKTKISLRDLLRLLRKELKTSGTDWKMLFKENLENQSALAVLENEVTQANLHRSWQSILCATNEIIELSWSILTNTAKIQFLKKYSRVWLNNRTPIPLSNAKKLIKIIKIGQLEFIPRINSIVYDSRLQKYSIRTENNATYLCETVINATGPSRYIHSCDFLMNSLLEEGLARENAFGGLDVDFETASLLDSEGNKDNNLRLLGHNTTGTYGYTSSLEMITKKAQIIAINLANLIQETNYDKNKMVNDARVDPFGHIASFIN
ncbi:FAD/NAD(P)-binding protein [Legionella dresdenensis]|uniref:FAD/NAD(P)-binding protein n=1 Tax=Legionella dresdenensis TaxID=450200 RepID=A0ABV8CF88_9GAMM